MNPLGLTCSVALSDFGLKGTGTIMGFNAGMLSEPLRLAVPQKNPNYVFTKESLSIMATWWEVGAREPLFITGPHGSGKTSFVQQFCARVGAPLISITARSRLDRTDLIGHYVIDPGQKHALCRRSAYAGLATRVRVFGQRDVRFAGGSLVVGQRASRRFPALYRGDRRDRSDAPELSNHPDR